MVLDLKDRERASFAPNSSLKAKEDEERIARKLKDEIARIRAMHANKRASTKTGSISDNEGRGGVGLDKEKVLKVYWERIRRIIR
ncbi:hypothetical protein PTKIN_Ptkin10aG0164800 [Pterospermum kingtungense]